MCREPSSANPAWPPGSIPERVGTLERLRAITDRQLASIRHLGIPRMQARACILGIPRWRILASCRSVIARSRSKVPTLSGIDPGGQAGFAEDGSLHIAFAYLAERLATGAAVSYRCRVGVLCAVHISLLCFASMPG